MKCNGTWFYLPAISRLLAVTKSKQTFHYQDFVLLKKKNSHNSTHTQKCLPHSFFFSYLRLMFTTPTNDSTYIESKHRLSSVKPFGVFSRSGISCFLYSTEVQTTLKDYRSRLHVRGFFFFWRFLIGGAIYMMKCVLLKDGYFCLHMIQGHYRPLTPERTSQFS